MEAWSCGLNANNLAMTVTKNVTHARRVPHVMGVAATKTFFAVPSNRIPTRTVMALISTSRVSPDVARCFIERQNRRRKPWAWLLKHVFAIDVNVCPKNAGRMKWRQVALTADAIREGLARAGLSARGPPKRKRVAIRPRSRAAAQRSKMAVCLD
jgi:hypothetical protein